MTTTYTETKAEIAEYIENVVPTNGIYTIRTMFMAQTNTVELRHPR